MPPSINGFGEIAADRSAVPATFGAALLFIDDRPDATVFRATSAGAAWDWWTQECNRSKPACNGECVATLFTPSF